MFNSLHKPLTRILQIVAVISLTLCYHSTSLANPETEINRQEAIEIAKESHPGKVLKIQKKALPKGTIYKIKILTKDGHVKHVKIDAATGKVKTK